MKSTLVRNLAGPIIGGIGGFIVNRWVTCTSGG
jgi:hypothetical protein